MQVDKKEEQSDDITARNTHTSNKLHYCLIHFFSHIFTCFHSPHLHISINTWDSTNTTLRCRLLFLFSHALSLLSSDPPPLSLITIEIICCLCVVNIGYVFCETHFISRYCKWIMGKLHLFCCAPSMRLLCRTIFVQFYHSFKNDGI